jgi:SAM-dependent methyltransferase
MLRAWLAHPLTRGMDLDDPRTTQLWRGIVREKSFLRQVYQEWYTALVAALPKGRGAILEIGSGAGFLDEYISGLITSDIFYCPGISAVLDGRQLPFADGVLRGIVMTGVLHHLPQPRAFLAEATRCVQPGGVLVMIEPWVTRWSRLIYGRLHHEPFEPAAQDWEFPSGGPLSGANIALPWIIFERDRAQFEREFAGWQIQEIRLTMPFRYLVSGGISTRALMPGWAFSAWRWLENALRPWMKDLAMFALIVLEKGEKDGSTTTGRLY